MMSIWEPDRFAGMPVIRSGDKVFLMNNAPMLSVESMRQDAERISLMLDEYRCPFSILDEFEQWWQWHRRTLFEKRSTGCVTCEMLSDRDRIKAHKIDRTISFGARYDWWGELVREPRAVLTNTFA